MTDRHLEATVDVCRIDVVDPNALLPGAFTGDEVDPGDGHLEELGDELDDGRVGSSVGGRGGDTDVEGVTVAPGDGGSSGPGLDVEPKEDVGRSGVTRRVSSFWVHYLKQVLGHVAIL